MKKLSIISLIALILGLMPSLVLAQNLTFDFNGDGIGDTMWFMDLGETVDVDIYVDNWDTGGWPSEPMFGVKMQLIIDNPTKVQVNSGTPYDTENGGIWDPAFSVFTDLCGGVYCLHVADFDCQAITNKLKLFTVQLQCIGGEIATSIHLEAKASGSAHFGMITPGGVACGSPHGEDANDGTAVLYLHFCNTDFDGDGVVDLFDLIIMKNEYGRTDCKVNPCDADVDGDGEVGLFDLILIIRTYGKHDCPVVP